MKKSKKIFNIFMVMISLVCCLGMFTACKKDNEPEVIAITQSMIELEYQTVVYDRLAKTPTVVLKNGETTINSAEYSVEYENNTNVGTAKVTVTAKEGSTVVSGSASKEFEITVAELPELVVDYFGKNYAVYDGDAKNPSVSISGLTMTDYDLSWEYKELGADDEEYVTLNTLVNNFVEKGNYKVTATGKGNYTGEVTAVYSIFNAFGNVTLSSESADYTGASHIPTATVDGLVEGVDYEISYAYKAPGETEFVSYEVADGKENSAFVNAGVYRVIATGKGIYGGEKVATFTINAINLPAINMSSGVVYDGSSKTPSYSVTSLTENQHYTIAWFYRPMGGTFTEYNLNPLDTLNFINAGEYKLVVTGIGNYKNTQETIYTIAKATISATVSKTSYTYNGDKGKLNTGVAISETPTITYYYKAGTHTEIGDASEWAEYSLDLNLNAGVYSLYSVVSGLVNYEDTTTAIIQFEVYKDELKGIPNLSGAEYIYDGQSHDPQLQVYAKLGTQTLVEGVDYVLQWRRQYGGGQYDVEYIPDPKHPELNFIDEGVYTVKLYGYGNYTISDRTAINCETYFTIINATMDDFTVQRQGYIYGSTPTDFELKGVNGTHGVATLGATITYQVKKMGLDSNPWVTITKDTALEAGTYIIRAIASGVANYNDKYTKSTPLEGVNLFTVSGAYLAENALPLSITDNDVETLNVSGNETILDGATITYYYYAVGSVGEPKVLAEDTVLEAGEYKIYAVVSNMKNYNDFTTNTVDYVVEEVAQEPTE